LPKSEDNISALYYFYIDKMLSHIVEQHTKLKVIVKNRPKHHNM